MRPTPRGRHNLFVTSSGLYTRLKCEYANSQSIDLSDYSAVMYIRNSPSTNNYLLKLTNILNNDSTGIDMNNANNGIVNIQITPVSTSMIPAGKIYYSLDVYSGSYYLGLLEGKIIK